MTPDQKRKLQALIKAKNPRQAVNAVIATLRLKKNVPENKPEAPQPTVEAPQPTVEAPQPTVEAPQPKPKTERQLIAESGIVDLQPESKEFDPTFNQLLKTLTPEQKRSLQGKHKAKNPRQAILAEINKIRESGTKPVDQVVTKSEQKEGSLGEKDAPNQGNPDLTQSKGNVKKDIKEIEYYGLRIKPLQPRSSENHSEKDGPVRSVEGAILGTVQLGSSGKDAHIIVSKDTTESTAQKRLSVANTGQPLSKRSRQVYIASSGEINNSGEAPFVILAGYNSQKDAQSAFNKALINTESVKNYTFTPVPPSLLPDILAAFDEDSAKKGTPLPLSSYTKTQTEGLHKAQEIVDGFTSILDLPDIPVHGLYESLPKSRTAQAQAGLLHGAYNRKYKTVFLNPKLLDDLVSGNGDKRFMAIEVLAHETGHALFTEKYNAYKDKAKVDAAYKDWLKSVQDEPLHANVRFSRAPYHRGLYLNREIKTPRDAYSTNFEEWVADHVARHLTLGPKAREALSKRSPVEKFFADIATLFEKLVDNVKKLLGNSADKFLADKSIAEWVDSVITQADAKLDLQQQRMQTPHSEQLMREKSRAHVFARLNREIVKDTRRFSQAYKQSFLVFAQDNANHQSLLEGFSPPVDTDYDNLYDWLKAEGYYAVFRKTPASDAEVIRDFRALLGYLQSVAQVNEEARRNLELDAYLETLGDTPDSLFQLAEEINSENAAQQALIEEGDPGEGIIKTFSITQEGRKASVETGKEEQDRTAWVLNTQSEAARAERGNLIELVESYMPGAKVAIDVDSAAFNELPIGLREELYDIKRRREHEGAKVDFFITAEVAEKGYEISAIEQVHEFDSKLQTYDDKLLSDGVEQMRVDAILRARKLGGNPEVIKNNTLDFVHRAPADEPLIQRVTTAIRAAGGESASPKAVIKLLEGDELWESQKKGLRYRLGLPDNTKHRSAEQIIQLMIQNPPVNGLYTLTGNTRLHVKTLAWYGRQMMKYEEKTPGDRFNERDFLGIAIKALMTRYMPMTLTDPKQLDNPELIYKGFKKGEYKQKKIQKNERRREQVMNMIRDAERAFIESGTEFEERFKGIKGQDIEGAVEIYANLHNLAKELQAKLAKSEHPKNFFNSKSVKDRIGEFIEEHEPKLPEGFTRNDLVHLVKTYGAYLDLLKAEQQSRVDAVSEKAKEEVRKYNKGRPPQDQKPWPEYQPITVKEYKALTMKFFKNRGTKVNKEMLRTLSNIHDVKFFNNLFHQFRSKAQRYMERTLYNDRFNYTNKPEEVTPLEWFVESLRDNEPANLEEQIGGTSLDNLDNFVAANKGKDDKPTPQELPKKTKLESLKWSPAIYGAPFGHPIHSLLADLTGSLGLKNIPSLDVKFVNREEIAKTARKRAAQKPYRRGDYASVSSTPEIRATETLQDRIMAELEQRAKQKTQTLAFTVFENGKVSIYLDDKFSDNFSDDILHVIGHEVGHIVFRSYLSNEFKNNGAVAKRLREQFEADKDQGWDSIEEWFAEEVSVWVRDRYDRQPNNLAESIIKRMTDLLKQIVKWVNQWGRSGEKMTVEQLLDTIVYREAMNGRINGMEAKDLEKILKNADMSEAQNALYKYVDANLPQLPVPVGVGLDPFTVAKNPHYQRFARSETGRYVIRSLKKSVNMGKLLSNKLTKTADSWLRTQRNVEGKRIEAFEILADIWRHKPGSVAREKYVNVVRPFINNKTKLAQVRFEMNDEPMFDALRRENATWGNRLERIIDGKTDKEMDAIQKELVAGNPQSTEAKAIRKLLDEFHGYANNRMGNQLGFLSNFFPRHFDVDAMVSGEDEFKAILIKHGYSQSEADTVFGQITNAKGIEYWTNYGKAKDEDKQKNLAPGASSRKSREQITDIPDIELRDFLNTDLRSILHSYLHQMIKRAEFESRFGAPVKVGRKKDKEVWDHRFHLDSLMQMAEAEGATRQQLNEVFRIMEAYIGRLDSDMNPDLRVVFSWGQTYQNIRLLPLAVLSSFVDAANPVIRSNGNIKASMKGFREALKAYRKEGHPLWEMALINGQVSEQLTLNAVMNTLDTPYLTTTTNKVNEKFFRMIGMHQWTNFSRLYALATGKHFLKDTALKARQGNKDAQRWLDELGTDIGSVLAWDGESPLDMHNAKQRSVQIALNRFVQESVFLPDASQRPSWASSPYFMLVWHLKQFAFSFYDIVLKRMGREIINREGYGNKLMAALPILSLFPLAIIGAELRDLIQHSMPWHEGEKPHQEKTGWERALWYAERSGVLGPLQLVLDADRQSEWQGLGVFSIFGPTASQAVEVLDKGAATGFIRALPGVAVMPEERAALKDFLFSP